MGLFALRPIKKKTRISEYRGRRLGLDAAIKAEKSGNRYLYEVNSKITIDGAKHGNIARYFNHSCNPNCDTFIRNKRVFIRTLRNIKPEEELTYDYGRDYLKNVIGLENCLCSRCTKRRKKVAAEARAKRARKAKRLANAAVKGKTSKTKKSKAKKTTRKTKKKSAKKRG
ncbi:MAG: SET domain-containing protein [Pseudolabrys sp.]|nr:SET domain-containing protein [Pseudolabrys sp.]